jgi:hypothetical protein
VAQVVWCSGPRCSGPRSRGLLGDGGLLRFIGRMRASHRHTKMQYRQFTLLQGAAEARPHELIGHSGLSYHLWGVAPCTGGGTCVRQLKAKSPQSSSPVLASVCQAVTSIAAAGPRVACLEYPPALGVPSTAATRFSPVFHLECWWNWLVAWWRSLPRRARASFGTGCNTGNCCGIGICRDLRYVWDLP